MSRPLFTSGASRGGALLGEVGRQCSGRETGDARGKELAHQLHEHVACEAPRTKGGSLQSVSFLPCNEILIDLTFSCKPPISPFTGVEPPTPSPRDLPHAARHHRAARAAGAVVTASHLRSSSCSVFRQGQGVQL